jgi:hypothetical protein
MDRTEANEMADSITQNLFFAYLFGLECARSGVPSESLHAAMTSELETVLESLGHAGTELEALCINKIDRVFWLAKKIEQRSLQGRSDD